MIEYSEFKKFQIILHFAMPTTNNVFVMSAVRNNGRAYVTVFRLSVSL